MKIFVLNCGSSSVKFQLIDMTTEDVIAKGIVEKVGTTEAIVNYQRKGDHPISEIHEIIDHNAAINKITSMLMDSKIGVIKDRKEIAGVGHRVVHGGEEFASSVLITDKVKKKVEECSKFAPLHNPANLKGIYAAEKVLPGIPQIGVFDTAFHQQMPKTSYLYALPYLTYKKLGIRRYGFHGTSHRYVSEQAAELLNKPLKSLNLITCHLGNGASIAAVKGGISIDTSMGFTPLEGLVMGTRCGDIDPAIVPYLMTREKLDANAIDSIMNKKSGLLGLSTVSNDMRELQEEAENGNEQCMLAIDIFCYRIKKYIGAYSASLGGVDAVIFTGGIGENSSLVRKKVCENMEFLGIFLDDEKNNAREKQKRDITKPDSKVKVLVIPTNEELVIARDTKEIIDKLIEKDKEQIPEEIIRNEISALTEMEKAELIKIWAVSPHLTEYEIRDKFQESCKKELHLATVKKILSDVKKAGGI